MNAKTSNKSLTSIAYKTFAALMIVMLALTVLPITMADAATVGYSAPTVSNPNDGSGFTNPNNAFTNDALVATSTVTGRQQQYTTFNFAAIPAGSTINGIEVQVIGRSSSNFTTRTFGAELSWNNGTTWTASGFNTGNLTTADATYTLGGTANNWGRTWAVGDFTNANFRVRVQSNLSGGATLSLNLVQVRVTYTAPVAPAFTSAATATFNVGAANTFTVAASGSPAPTFTETGALPTGVTFSAAGVLSGTPAAGTVGSYPITITASNGTLPNATQAFTLTVQKANTTTTISSDTPDPSLAGQNVVVNYTVAPSAANAIARTGNVTVSDGVNSCTGTAAAGTCTLALTTGGSRPLTATYAGDANFNGSASVAAAHTVNASYTINASAGAGGTINPAGAVVVAGGANQAFSSTPNTTFILSDLLVDSASVGKANSYTFNAVTANHTIAASFNGGWSAPTASTNVLVATTPDNVFVSDNAYAAYSSLGETATYINFNIPAIPAGSTINGIEVAVEGYNATNTRNVQIQLSWNGGTTFTAATTTSLTVADSTLILGGAANTWGRGWSNTEFTNANFRVKATATSPGSSPAYIDQLQVKVTYTVPSVAPTITSAAPAGGTQGIAYTHTYAATGTTPITFSLTAGTLPPGLTLTAGVLSGTPTTPGTYAGTVTAANGTLPNATQNFSIVIAAVSPTITSAAPLGGTDGVPYSHTYTANGTTPITFSLTTGTLPPGLTLTSAGVLSGTPTTPGTYTGTVTATNGTLPNATQAFSITIAAVPPTITSAAPSNGVQGAAYSHTYTATGTAPITFSSIPGSLPPGLNLTSAGVLSGTPTTIGTYSGVVTATNGTLPDATQSFNITISLAPSITSGNNTSFTLGSAGSFTVAATGFPLPTLSVTGALPSGVTFTPATGVLAGTPAAGTAGIYPLTFTATNGVTPNAVQNFTLTVTEGPSITSANNVTFSILLAGTFKVTAIGVPDPTLSMTGTLPGGVTFNPATGTLAGTPNVGTAGVYPLTFNAVNGTSPDAAQSFTLTVKNGPVIAPNGINSVPDTGNGSISNNEVIAPTLGITKLIVKFDEDVYNVASGDPDFGKSVANPANYMLILSSTGGTFATVNCRGGVQPNDAAIAISSVTYSNGGGAGPFVATLTIATPLNTAGYYQLFVCGTTSIVDAKNTDLKLAGNGTAPGSDFLINFRLRSASSNGGGGSTRKASDAAKAVEILNATLIPVTGFSPNTITALPAQPTDKAYSSLDGIRIEIPTLHINYPIVGVMFDKNNWDLTWLKDSVGYLEGSAYPTLEGNTVLSAHVVDANDNLGPFSDIKGMKTGEKVYIHAYGQVYVYQVQENRLLLPSNTSTVFQHEENSWVTLVTCEDYNAKTGLYNYRRMVRAILISVVPEKK